MRKNNKQEGKDTENWLEVITRMNFINSQGAFQFAIMFK